MEIHCGQQQHYQSLDKIQVSQWAEDKESQAYDIIPHSNENLCTFLQTPQINFQKENFKQK
jgi:hypothetical protein